MTARSFEPEGPYAKAVFEWLLAVAPVAAYVIAEHMFVGAGAHGTFLGSAEWGIASSFLCILTIYLLLLDMPRHSTARWPVKLGSCRIAAFLLFMCLLGSIYVAVAILQIPQAGQAGEAAGHLDTRWLYAFHWGIFAVSSAAFIFLKSLAERIVEPAGHDCRQAVDWKFESISLGELRAQSDQQFPEHWTPNPSFDEACRREVSLVFGAKGGGKSAFRRYISEIRKSRDLAVTSVDLQDFRYDPVADQVTALARATGSDAIETLTRYWRNLLLLRCLEESVARVADDTRAHEVATGKALAVLGEHRERRADAGLLAMLGKAHQALRSIFVRDTGISGDFRVRGLTTDEYDRVERSSEDPELNDACVHIAGLLRAKRVMICTVVDGIDRVADSVSKAALSIVLNSLVRAADRITLDASLADAFCVKILMPRELFTDVQGRDIDHLLAIQRDLDWNPEILLALITRRLSVASARVGGPQQVDFLRMLPNRDETWIHIVRHSMYRPRQLLLYLDAIRQLSAGQGGVTDAVVSKAIEGTSLKLAHAFIEEYRISLPSLPMYLEAFAGQKAVTTLRSLEARLRAVFKRHGLSGSVTRAVSELYFTGALGHVHELAPGSSDPSACYKVVDHQRVAIACEFSYKPAARNSWLSGMPKDTVVALHPMLMRHASARAVEDHFIG